MNHLDSQPPRTSSVVAQSLWGSSALHEAYLSLPVRPPPYPSLPPITFGSSSTAPAALSSSSYSRKQPTRITTPIMMFLFTLGFINTVSLASCSGQIKDLTGELRKIHEFPSAHGGFSDIWICEYSRGRQLQR